jgi:K+-sensing histidine kinase KdpD
MIKAAYDTANSLLMVNFVMINSKSQSLDIQKLLEIFNSSDQTSKGDTANSEFDEVKMGLAICKSIVESCGGKLDKRLHKRSKAIEITISMRMREQVSQ